MKNYHENACLYYPLPYTQTLGSSSSPPPKAEENNNPTKVGTKTFAAPEKANYLPSETETESDLRHSHGFFL